VSAFEATTNLNDFFSCSSQLSKWNELLMRESLAVRSDFISTETNETESKACQAKIEIRT